LPMWLQVPTGQMCLYAKKITMDRNRRGVSSVIELISGCKPVAEVEQEGNCAVAERVRRGLRLWLGVQEGAVPADASPAESELPDPEPSSLPDDGPSHCSANNGWSGRPRLATSAERAAPMRRKPIGPRRARPRDGTEIARKEGPRAAATVRR